MKHGKHARQPPGTPRSSLARARPDWAIRRGGAMIFADAPEDGHRTRCWPRCGESVAASGQTPADLFGEPVGVRAQAWQGTAAGPPTLLEGFPALPRRRRCPHRSCLPAWACCCSVLGIWTWIRRRVVPPHSFAGPAMLLFPLVFVLVATGPGDGCCAPVVGLRASLGHLGGNPGGSGRDHRIGGLGWMRRNCPAPRTGPCHRSVRADRPRLPGCPCRSRGSWSTTPGGTTNVGSPTPRICCAAVTCSPGTKPFRRCARLSHHRLLSGAADTVARDFGNVELFTAQLAPDTRAPIKRGIVLRRAGFSLIVALLRRRDSLPSSLEDPITRVADHPAALCGCAWRRGFPGRWRPKSIDVRHRGSQKRPRGRCPDSDRAQQQKD